MNPFDIDCLTLLPLFKWKIRESQGISQTIPRTVSTIYNHIFENNILFIIQNSASIQVQKVRHIITFYLKYQENYTFIIE